MGKKTWLAGIQDSDLKHDNQFLVAIVQSLWNADITNVLLENCRKTLIELGSDPSKIIEVQVPGAFEIPTAAQMLIQAKKPDAVITLGCVVKGQTDHDQYINKSISQGLVQLSLIERVPCIFGVLTTNTYDQARERADGTVENKGKDCALSAIRMLQIKKDLTQSNQGNIGFLK